MELRCLPGSHGLRVLLAISELLAAHSEIWDNRVKPWAIDKRKEAYTVGTLFLSLLGLGARQDALLPIHEGGRSTGPGHLVFRRLDDGAEQFEGQLSMCQRDLEHTQGRTLIGSSAGSALKEAVCTGASGCVLRFPKTGAELLPFLLGHPRVEALSLKVEVNSWLSLQKETKQGSAF